MSDRSWMALMRLVPRSAVSRAAGALSIAPLPSAVHRVAARAFAWRYRVDLSEAEKPIGEYATFGEFFTRRLRPGARPIAEGEDVVVSPVDGLVAAVGEADEGRLLQAKGRDYSIAALLDDAEMARSFASGTYLTLYLSPRDYHRIHVPLSGEVESLRYVPGTLFPVNAPAVRSVPQLFCVNERLITYLRTRAGRVAVVKVGATCVGRIRVSYDTVLTHAGLGPTRKRYEPPIALAKGEELGVFELGSTVILLFEPGRVSLGPKVVEGQRVRVGEGIGRVVVPSP